MYNNTGLQTPRGSGSNGYVQSNKAFLKPRVSNLTDSSITAGSNRNPSKEILEHDRKRQIQLKLLVLEESLIDRGYTDSEIAEKMEEKRRSLEEADALEDGEIGVNLVIGSKISDAQSHQAAARKERQMETLRDALGIGADGESQSKRPVT